MCFTHSEQNIPQDHLEFNNIFMSTIYTDAGSRDHRSTISTSIYSHQSVVVPPPALLSMAPLAHNASSAAFEQASINPRSVKPLGNLVLAPANLSSARTTSLGKLSTLPDEFLLLIFAELSPFDLHRSQAVSKYFFAWCTGLDALWKPGFISRNNERLSAWKGTWRSSYIYKFLISTMNNQSLHLPTDSIKTPNVFSDVLFQPILCVHHSINSIISRLTSSRKLNSNIHKLTIDQPKTFQFPNKPSILKGLIELWPAYKPSSSHSWSLDSLIERYPKLEFRAESTLTTLTDYRNYHDNCLSDESPIYLFDSQFVENSSTPLFQRGLGEDFSVPEIFQQDLFSCLGDQRPDYRWIIIGPARSGSTWHIDPNGTSAWNAVITGRKYWICFPPHITPPGVLVNDDESEVQSPLSISEWFLNYYEFAKETYGRFSKDPETRGLMLEGICEAGETFFVPSGWWHLVVNLEPSIAITQNFVSNNELISVLHFMKYKPDQLSGFKFNRNDLTEKTDFKSQMVTWAPNISTSIFQKFITKLLDSQEISDQRLNEILNSVERIEFHRTQDRSTKLKIHHRNNEEEYNHYPIKKRKNQPIDQFIDPFSIHSIWNQIKKHQDLSSVQQNNQINHQLSHTHQSYDIPLKNCRSDQNLDTGGFKFDFEFE